MLRTHLTYRCAASMLGVVLATAAIGVLVDDLTTRMLAMLLVGVAGAVAGVAFVMRPIRKATGRLNSTSAALSGTDDDLQSLESVSQTLSRQVRRLLEEIDQLRRREADLEQNAALLETVLGTMIEGVIVVDGAERMLFANSAARKLLDIDSADVGGRPLLEVVRAVGIAEAVRAALSSESVHHSEFEVPRKSCIVSMSASTFPGRPYSGAVLVFHDVTDLRRLERMRREFASNVSHELKTPLTAVQAYADTLLNGALEDPEHNRVFVERIVEQADRLEALIADMMQIAEIESEEAVFAPQPVHLSAAVEESLQSQSPVAANNGVRLQVETADDVTIQVDPDGLRQIVDNLLKNAIAYTPAEGTVTVRVRSEGDWGVFEVEDTGIGISRKDQQRIFERFYRADRARSRDAGGTGLGLSIVKHVLQACGGRVELASELEKGSRFTVYLPMGKTVAASAPAAPQG